MNATNRDFLKKQQRQKLISKFAKLDISVNLAENVSNTEYFGSIDYTDGIPVTGHDLYEVSINTDKSLDEQIKTLALILTLYIYTNEDFNEYSVIASDLNEFIENSLNSYPLQDIFYATLAI